MHRNPPTLDLDNDIARYLCDSQGEVRTALDLLYPENFHGAFCFNDKYRKRNSPMSIRNFTLLYSCQKLAFVGRQIGGNIFFSVCLQRGVGLRDPNHGKRDMSGRVLTLFWPEHIYAHLFYWEEALLSAQEVTRTGVGAEQLGGYAD